MTSDNRATTAGVSGDRLLLLRSPKDCGNSTYHELQQNPDTEGGLQPMLFQSFRQPQASAVAIVADITAVPWRRNVGLARAQLQEGSVAGVAGSLHVLRS